MKYNIWYPMNENDLHARLLAPGLVGDVLESRRIFIRGLVLDLQIGVHAHEQVRAQKVAIDVELYLEPGPPPVRDALVEVLDYDQVRERVREVALAERVKLQETLVERIAEVCLAMDGVRGVRIATEKLEVFEDARGVGYELVRLKAE